MGWRHPEISLEEMVKLTKGFVDILILASGYQSSARLAHWDALNIKKAFQWGLFFETVFSRLSISDIYQDSVKELDAALSEMTSSASFPQGLAHLSSATLTKARGYVIQHLIHTVALRVAHLTHFLTAIIEMDLDELSETEHDSLNAYLNRLTLHNSSLISVPDKKNSVISSLDVGDDLTKYVVQEILKRKCAVSCISTVETGLDILSNTIRHGSESDNNLLNEQLNHGKAPTNIEPLLEFITWNHWKSRHLSYFLDKRTVRLVSGASLIFSAPKVQWIQVFQGLNISAKSGDNDICETIESGILEYLTEVLGGQLHQLWKISPALAAAAIPSWSPLLRLYLSEMETQFKGKFPVIRCCNCTQDVEELKDCELAERIWCLYIFHVLGSHLTRGASGAL